jgi:sugar lactone lactonase YvrE
MITHGINLSYKVILSLILLVMITSASSNASIAQQPPSNASIAQQPPSNASISCPPVPSQHVMTKPDQNKEQLATSFLTNVTLDIREKLQALDKDPTQALDRDLTEQTRQELQELAVDRKKSLVELIRINPDAAMSFILFPEEIRTLDNITDNCVETLAVLQGKVYVEVAESLEGNFSLERYQLLTNDSNQTINIHPAFGLSTPLRSGSEIAVRGFIIDNDLIFDGSSPPNSAQTTGLLVLNEPPPIQAIQGPQNILVLVVNFVGTSLPDLPTVDDIRTDLNGVNQFYQTTSYGRISFSRADVFGPFQLSISDPCSSNDDDVRAAVAAADPSVFFPDYERIVIVAPYGPNCWDGAAGVGTFPGEREIRIATQDGEAHFLTQARIKISSFGPILLAHELGHNFGFSHAASIDCGGNSITTNFPTFNDCNYDEYGDPYDIMGDVFRAGGHFNAPHMESADWFTLTNIMTVTDNGRFTLEPIETPSSGLKAIKIPRGNGDFIYIEYRQPISYDRVLGAFGGDVFQGATLHILGSRSPSYPYIVDATPDGSNHGRGEFFRSVLQVGSSFFDPQSHVTITVVSADSNGVTVDVNFHPSAIFVSHRYAFDIGWGSRGSLSGQFDFPTDIAVDSSGNVYVSDSANSRIQKFDSRGQFVTEWGSSGTGIGQFEIPLGLALDQSTNSLYVVDYWSYDIQKYLLSNPCPSTLIEIVPGVCFVTKWGSPGNGNGEFQIPSSVAVDASGNVYVADSGNRRIQKFTFSSPCPEGTTQVSVGVCFVTKWGSSCHLNQIVRCIDPDGPGPLNKGDGQFGWPSSIAVDSAGNVFVVDNSNNRIQKFTSNGQFVTKWGFSGSGYGQFMFRVQTGLAIDSSNNVYVTDQNNHRIQKFTNNGAYITQWGSYCNIVDGAGCLASPTGLGDGQFNRPSGVEIDSNTDAVYVTDELNNRIQKFILRGLLPFPVS